MMSSKLKLETIYIKVNMFTCSREFQKRVFNHGIKWFIFVNIIPMPGNQQNNNISHENVVTT